MSTRYSGGNERGVTYNVGPMVTASAVHWALTDSRHSAIARDPEYVKAIFRSYVDVKMRRGRTKADIAYKLELLEEDLPSHLQEMAQVRQECGLPASRVSARNGQAGSRVPSTAPLAAPLTTRASGQIRRAFASGRAGGADQSEAQVQQVVAATRRPGNPEDEPPPPPYTRDDADPESTQILQERLAAEAETQHSVPADSPPAPRRPHLPQIATAPAGHADATQPDTPPSDEEMRRVWEESQFEEAKRMSIAAQREEDELDEAMRLSLADAGSGEQLPGEGEAGPSEQPPGAWVGDTQAPSARRIASQQHLGPGPSRSPHRRVVSDAAAAKPDTSTLQTGMQGMTIPDDWQGGAGPSRPPGPRKLQSNNPFLSPHERESLEYPGAEGDQVQYPGLGFGLPDNDEGMEHLSPPMQPNSPSRHSSANSLRDSAGSRRTSYNMGSATPQRTERPLPSTPGRRPDKTREEEHYEPPPGPPPPHLRVRTPSEQPAPPRLPPRRETTTAFSPNLNQNLGGNLAKNQNYPVPPPMMSPSILGLNAPFAPTSSASDARSPYHQTPPPASSSSGLGRHASTTSNLQNGEDPLEMLKDFDTVFLVDDSLSMAGERWAQAQKALMDVADIAAQYDEDGVDLYFLHSKRVGKELKSGSDVEDVFSGLLPKGSSPTGARIEQILREYMVRLERSVITNPLSPTAEAPPTLSAEERIKPMNLIVITDGVFTRPVAHRTQPLSAAPTLSRNASLREAPSDDPESVILAAAKRLDKGDFPLSQVGIQFLQIGDDAEAREALQDLDDGLFAAHGVRDMVDTVLFDGQQMGAGLIIKTLLGGINRRVDTRSGP